MGDVIQLKQKNRGVTVIDRNGAEHRYMLKPGERFVRSYTDGRLALLDENGEHVRFLKPQEQ